MQVRGKEHQHDQGTVDLGSGWIRLFDILFMYWVVWPVFLSNNKHREGRRLKCCLLQVTIIIFLSVVGALLLYMLFLLMVDPLIRKPDPLAQTLHNEEDSEVTARICIFIGLQLVWKSLKLLNVCILMCLFSGNAPTNEQRHTERKHGPGAGGGCTAALEEAGPGATQDCLWPP